MFQHNSTTKVLIKVHYLKFAIQNMCKNYGLECRKLFFWNICFDWYTTPILSAASEYSKEFKVKTFLKIK